MKSNLVLALQLAGLMHVGLIAAGLAMPRVVDLHGYIATLPEFVRRLFWTYYGFVGLCLVSFGLISFVFANALAEGGALARAVCVFLTAFWLLRLVAAAFIFDVRPYLKTGLLRAGYWATNVVFLYLPAVYLWTALKA